MKKNALNDLFGVATQVHQQVYEAFVSDLRTLENAQEEGMVHAREIYLEDAKKESYRQWTWNWGGAWQRRDPWQEFLVP